VEHSGGGTSWDSRACGTKPSDRLPAERENGKGHDICRRGGGKMAAFRAKRKMVSAIAGARGSQPSERIRPLGEEPTRSTMQRIEGDTEILRRVPGRCRSASPLTYRLQTSQSSSSQRGPRGGPWQRTLPDRLRAGTSSVMVRNYLQKGCGIKEPCDTLRGNLSHHAQRRACASGQRYLSG